MFECSSARTLKPTQNETIIKAAFFLYLGAVGQTEHNTPGKFVMANVLANSCLFSHPADTEQYGSVLHSP